MRFLVRSVRLLPGILAPLLACSAARAQIHEEKPGPGLEEGLLLDADATKLSDEPGKVKLAKSVGTGDFSVVINTEIKEPREAPNVGLYADHGADSGWYVRLTSEDAVELAGLKVGTREKLGFATPAHEIVPNRPVLIVATIKRDARQPLSGIWIDGIEVASAAIPPVECAAPGSWVNADLEGVKSLRVRVYDRALTRPEILDLQLSSSRRKEAQTSGSATSPAPATPNAQKSVPPHVGSYPPAAKHPAPPPNGPRFIPQQDETIALIGGTEAVALAESGELEALLLMAFPNTRFHFRSLAWEGDTVFKQDRPMNFGSLEQQLRRVNAGAVFVMFGRQECLDAEKGISEKGKGKRDETGLAEFKTAFGKLLDTVEKVTPNIVVIGPWVFEPQKPPLPSFTDANKAISSYNATLAEMAKDHNCTFVVGPEVTMGGATSDGVTFAPDGSQFLSLLIMQHLNIEPTPRGIPVYVYMERLKSSFGPINRAIQSKNRLWHDYWRPSNWAFLHGDRTNQPSSRDPVNPQIRFFPSEQEKYLPLIKQAEDKIYQTVQEAQKKLP